MQLLKRNSSDLLLHVIQMLELQLNVTTAHITFASRGYKGRTHCLFEADSCSCYKFGCKLKINICFIAKINKWDQNCFSSVQFSRSVMSYSLRPHELQHARPPCPLSTSGVHPNPCQLSLVYKFAKSNSSLKQR